MNYREVIFLRFLSQLRQLVLPLEEDKPPTVTECEPCKYVQDFNKALSSQPSLSCPAPSNFRSWFRSVDEGPLPELPPTAPNDVPRAYVSWAGARNDLQAEIINHIRELLGIRADFILSKRVGVQDLQSETNIRNIERTVAELMGDLDTLINHNNVQSIGHGGIRITAITIESWELDQQYRGGDIEVLTVVWRMQVEGPHSPMTPGTMMPGGTGSMTGTSGSIFD